MKLYQVFIQPRSKSPDIRSRELVLNYLLLGSITMAVLALCNTLFSFTVFRQTFLSTRIVVILSVLVIFCLLYYFARFKRHYFTVSVLLVGFFFLAGAYLAFLWSAVTPTGVLVFGFAIVMAGVLIGAKYSLYVAALTATALVLIQYFQSAGVIATDLSWMDRPPSMVDIIGFCAIYAILALISWLFNRQMEQSLRRAQRSEAALARQKSLLEIKVEERTRELEATQLEKVQQVYRFAELGRISSALFHDLANHLTSVSLNIEGLDKTEHSAIMKRIQQDIKYVDDVVQRVRFQLRGRAESERFNIIEEINQIINVLSYRATQSKITFEIKANGKKPLYYTGDITRFRQIVNNLLTNALESYPAPTAQLQNQRRILITVSKSSDTIKLTVKDWGYGISAKRQPKIFEPFYTDKPDGVGIGLFIVKQIVEQDFKGTIDVKSRLRGGTEFTISLPQKR